MNSIKMNCRSQASVEFLIVLSVVIMIFVLMSYVIYYKIIRSNDIKVFIHGRRVANSIADNINELNMVGEGYHHYFTIPKELYGGRNYTVSFFKGEPMVFIYGGSFVWGEQLAGGGTVEWSAPLSTTSIGCVRDECFDRCNISSDEICLDFERDMEVKVINEDVLSYGSRGSKIFLSYPYNIKQGSDTWSIIPYRGNNIWGDVDCKAGSYMYVYKNTTDGSTNLVFKHNSTNPLPAMAWAVRMNFLDYPVEDTSVVFSDDPGDIDLTSTNWEGRWRLPAGDSCDGGILTFKSGGIHLCIRADFHPQFGPPTWNWRNGDGSEISLSTNQDLCIYYP